MKVVWDWNHCGYDLFHWSLILFGFLVGYTGFCLGGVNFRGGGQPCVFGDI